MSERVNPNVFVLARIVLRLTFVIFSAVGFAVSALLIALAYAFERLYSVPALPWALATLSLPACGLIVLAFSTRLATFVAGNIQFSDGPRPAVLHGMMPPNKALERTGGEAAHGG